MVRDKTCHDAISSEFRRGPRALRYDETPVPVTQGYETQICGPCCVAMALDVPIKKALRYCHSDGGSTRTQQLRDALILHYDVAERLRRVKPSYTESDLPRKAILKVLIEQEDDSYSGHWVLYWNEYIYDPYYGAMRFDRWDAVVSPGRVSSYLEIKDYVNDSTTGPTAQAT